MKTILCRLYSADHKAAMTDLKIRLKEWKKNGGLRPVLSDIIKEWHEASRKDSKCS